MNSLWLDKNQCSVSKKDQKSSQGEGVGGVETLKTASELYILFPAFPNL